MFLEPKLLWGLEKMFFRVCMGGLTNEFGAKNAKVFCKLLCANELQIFDPHNNSLSRIGASGG